MCRFAVLVIVLLVAAAVWAQPKAPSNDVVLVTKDAPGITIRVVVDSSGKQIDAGQYIRIDVYNQVLKQAQIMAQVLTKHFGEITQVLYPDLAKALADSNIVMIDKRAVKFESVKGKSKKKGK